MRHIDFNFKSSIINHYGISNVNTSHHTRNKIIAIKIDHLKENSCTYDWNHIKEQNITILLNYA